MPGAPAVWVKVCGVTSVEGVRGALAAGVDAIGLNLVPSSPRRITAERARELVDAIGDAAEAVLVVADLPLDEVSWLLDFTRAARAQLHGDEPPDYSVTEPRCFHAVRLLTPQDLERAWALPGDRLLVDARVPGQLGGTGVRVPATLARTVAQRRPTVLAGGLTPENVAEAVSWVRPWGVDTAGGVEPPGQPGVKLAERMAAFVRAARAAAPGV